MFNQNDLINCANILSSRETTLQFPITHYNNNGDFDNEVIEAVLRSKGFGIINCEINLDDWINNGEPFMFIITLSAHHYSARRFEQNGDIWIFDSQLECAVLDSPLYEEKILVCLKNIFLKTNEKVYNEANIPIITYVYRTEQTFNYNEILFAPVNDNPLVIMNRMSYLRGILDMPLSSTERVKNWRSNEENKNNQTAVKKQSRSNIQVKQREQQLDKKARDLYRKDDENRIRDLENKYKSDTKRIANKSFIQKIPVYFESQESYLCGMHALNNMMQYKLFNIQTLIVVSRELKKKWSDRTFYTESPKGNFTSDVLEQALENVGLSVKALNQQQLTILKTDKRPIMLIISHRQHHYSARRFEQDGDLWIFDSMAKEPIIDKNEMFSFLLNHLRSKIDRNLWPLIQEVSETPAFEKRIFPNDSFFRDVQSKPKRNVAQFVLHFKKDLPKTVKKDNEILSEHLYNEEIKSNNENEIFENDRDNDDVTNKTTEKKIKNKSIDKNV